MKCIALGDRYLGDIAICPAYVNQVMATDAANLLISSIDDYANNLDSTNQEVSSSSSLVRVDDAGVSRAMGRTQDISERLMLLLIHGLLHLMG